MSRANNAFENKNRCGRNGIANRQHHCQRENLLLPLNLLCGKCTSWNNEVAQVDVNQITSSIEMNNLIFIIPTVTPRSYANSISRSLRSSALPLPNLQRQQGKTTEARNWPEHARHWLRSGRMAGAILTRPTARCALAMKVLAWLIGPFTKGMSYG